MSKQTVLVAVYGTLKKGEPNHRLLSDSEFVGKGHTLPNFDLVEMGSFPGAIKGNQSLTVEVYSVDYNTTFPNLDLLEGHPHFFERHMADIILTDHGDLPIKAWLYAIYHLAPQYKASKRCTTKDKNGNINWSYHTSVLNRG